VLEDPATRTRVPRTFRSLVHRDFRLWFATALVSNVGLWMQVTAQGWVVLTELTDDDALAAGATLALQFAPQLLLLPLAGLLADRVDRFALLLATQGALTVLSLGVGLLLLSGSAELGHLLAFALVLGVVNALDAPARQVVVADVVPQDEIPNAVALNLASHHAARLVGPAAAGVLIATVGSGWVFVVNAASFLPLLLGLAILVRRRRARAAVAPGSPDAEPGARLDLLGGFRYLGTRPDLRILLVMVFLFGLFGMNFALVAATMSVEFEAGAPEFGLLTSIMAIGSLAGALLAARRERARLPTVVAAGALMAAAALVGSLMPDFWAFAAVSTVIGFAGVTTFTTANSYLQVTTRPELRGRVMSIHVAVLAAGAPIGAPLLGWVAATAGARVALGGGALVAALACVLGIGWALATGHARVPERATRLGRLARRGWTP